VGLAIWLLMRRRKRRILIVDPAEDSQSSPRSV
jgi:hypothetical protein